MLYLKIADTHSGGSLFRSYSRPKLQAEFCPHAGLRSGPCKDEKTLDRCKDYCHFNSVFCKSSETEEKCSAYCAALTPVQLDCHMKYVSVAARCHNPEVPCFHRSVCNAAGSATAIGFESAPHPPAYRGPLRNPFMEDAKAKGGYDPSTAAHQVGQQVMGNSDFTDLGNIPERDTLTPGQRRDQQHEITDPGTTDA